MSDILKGEEGCFSSVIQDLKQQNNQYRVALELLNKVSASDMKDEQLTSSHFVLDITGEALREG